MMRFFLAYHFRFKSKSYGNTMSLYTQRKVSVKYVTNVAVGTLAGK